MGNIGDAISETIPAVGTSGTTYATNINAFLTEVKARLEADVPRASLAAGDLDLNGDDLQNAGYLGLATAASTPTTPVGSLQRYGNNLYWINNAGAVQITSGTSLNTTLVGGITGDYGGANPAQLRFVDADLEYYAYDDYAGGAWARVWARNFDIAAGATSAFRARLAFGGGGNVTYTLPSAAPAAAAFLQMDTSGNITASNNLARVKNIPGSMGIIANGAPHTFTDGVWTLGSSILKLFFPIEMDVGQVISSFTLNCIKNSDATNTLTAQLYYNSASSGLTTVGAAATNAANAPGAITLTTSGLARTVSANEFFVLAVEQSDSTPSASDTVRNLIINYT